MRKLMLTIYTALILSGCASAPKPVVYEPAPPVIVAPQKPVVIDDKLFQDCKRLPLLVRKIYTEQDTLAYNEEWIERYNECREQNRNTFKTLQRLLDPSK